MVHIWLTQGTAAVLIAATVFFLPWNVVIQRSLWLAFGTSGTISWLFLILLASALKKSDKIFYGTFFAETAVRLICILVLAAALHQHQEWNMVAALLGFVMMSLIWSLCGILWFPKLLGRPSTRNT